MAVKCSVCLKFLQLVDAYKGRVFVAAARWRLVVLICFYSVQFFNFPGELGPELRRVNVDALVCLDWTGSSSFVSRGRVIVFEEVARHSMQHVILSMQYFHVLDMT